MTVSATGKSKRRPAGVVKENLAAALAEARQELKAHRAWSANAIGLLADLQRESAAKIEGLEQRQAALLSAVSLLATGQAISNTQTQATLAGLIQCADLGRRALAAHIGLQDDEE